MNGSGNLVELRLTMAPILIAMNMKSNAKAVQHPELVIDIDHSAIIGRVRNIETNDMQFRDHSL
jgi:hypothetical protein